MMDIEAYFKDDEMSEYKEISNWEACKAKGEGKEVETYNRVKEKWLEISFASCCFRPDHKYRIKSPDPARLLGKTIWTKDGKGALNLTWYRDERYYIPSMNKNVENWYTALEIEKEFDVKD